VSRLVTAAAILPSVARDVLSSLIAASARAFDNAFCDPDLFTRDIHPLVEVLHVLCKTWKACLVAIAAVRIASELDSSELFQSVATGTNYSII
jgi:hypothetical protein